MSTVATTTYDQVLDGMVSGLQALAIPQGGAPSSGKYLRVCKRYMGERFDAQDAGERGVAGRCPAALVAFMGERTMRTTIGRRKDRVEATFVVICASDSRRSKDDRKFVLSMLYDVRKQIGDTKLSGLPIMPLRYSGVVVVAENDAVTAYAARFITRYTVDYSINPGSDTIIEADGQIVYPVVTPPTAPTVVVVGTPGTARYAYDVQALFAPNPASDFSAWTAISTAPNTLSASNKLQVSWPAVTGATGYVLRRRWAPVGVSTGVIYTGTTPSFIDDGSVTATGGVEPTMGRGLTYDGDF